jgi:hypothetical protein
MLYMVNQVSRVVLIDVFRYTGMYLLVTRCNWMCRVVIIVALRGNWMCHIVIIVALRGKAGGQMCTESVFTDLRTRSSISGSKTRTYSCQSLGGRRAHYRVPRGHGPVIGKYQILFFEDFISIFYLLFQIYIFCLSYMGYLCYLYLRYLFIP